MATFNYGIRKALNDKGINNGRVGYANGYVTVDGKNFMKSDFNKNGQSFTNQQNFSNAWNSFSQPSNSGNSPMVQAAQNVKSTPQATYSPIKTGDTLDRINEFISKQSQHQYTSPEPFRYDPNTDPYYQSQLAEAKKNIANQQIDTNAMLRSSGQGNSSWSDTVANQIATKGMESVANTILPQAMQQAYQRYSDDFNRNLQTQQLNYGVGQDAIGNLSNYYGLQDNEYFTKPMQEAQLTGNYLPTEARMAIDRLLGLKQQAETKGITAEARSELSKEADGIRAQLQALGINPSLYGSSVSYNQASQANPGIRTLQGQQMDLANKQANMDAWAQVASMTGNLGTGPKQNWQQLINNAYEGQSTLQGKEFQNMLDQQGWTRAWQTSQAMGYVTPDLSKLTGIPEGTNLFDAQVQMERLAMDQAQFQRQLDNDYYSQYIDQYNADMKAQGQTPTADSYYDVIKGMTQRDKLTNNVTNQDQIGAFISQTGLPEAEMRKLFSYAGITPPK